ncbi:hypothetical protein EYZ11_009560 [Aspergillus tanneri]|uniref:Uncharacterized protein n=1 Tax=Aspergillus tanneri TaxID=1220188 RepID=A0A4V3UNF5_9EURO|nr:uncharacterized protein ATNIH1004_005844 [Aspergillus tanneri]KAA8647156.1 hypothetical protein ATNIH1004_005844 [Aspergillus tanneri]THC90974.1 hypothetical protein EYZ11_009560 [Aspergillus tanneri]
MVFESLPTELRILILRSLPDEHTLKCLVHASPVYHDTYGLAKKDILCALVRRQYGVVGLEEPLAAIHSEGLHAEVACNKGQITTLLDQLRCHRESSLASSAEVPGTQESINLLHLHRKLRFLLNAYCARAPCPPGVDPNTWQQNLPLRPSATEKARILRALCRLQTYCNIFGSREWTQERPFDPTISLPCKRASSTWYRNFTIDRMWSLFFGGMPTWEVEEFGSVWMFIRHEYNNVFAQITREFPRSDPRWRALRPNSLPVDPWELHPSPDADDAHDCSIYCNHLVSLGPGFLFKVLTQPSREDSWRLVISNSISSKSSFQDLVEVVRDPHPLPTADQIHPEEDLSSVVIEPSQCWKQHWHDKGVYPRDGISLPAEESSPSSPQAQDLPVRDLAHFQGWEWGYAFWDYGRMHCGVQVF